MPSSSSCDSSVGSSLLDPKPFPISAMFLTDRPGFLAPPGGRGIRPSSTGNAGTRYGDPLRHRRGLPLREAGGAVHVRRGTEVADLREGHLTTEPGGPVDVPGGVGFEVDRLSIGARPHGAVA